MPTTRTPVPAPSVAQADVGGPAPSGGPAARSVRRLLCLVVVVVVLLGASAAPVTVAAAPAGSGSGARAFVWGNNAGGGLGVGSTARALSPVPVRLPAGTTEVVAGQGFTLALTTKGQLWAWGDNRYGQLGVGDTRSRLAPVRVGFPGGTRVSGVDADLEHAVAVTSSGRVYAWGRNAYGQVGDGGTTDRSRPVRAKVPSGIRVVSVAAGRDHTLAVTDAGGVLAWGRNSGGQLGDGTVTTRMRPVRVQLPAGRVVEVSAGVGHSAARTSAGRVLSWGASGLAAAEPKPGASAKGTARAFAARPVRLPGGARAVAVAAGGRHTLAVTRAGRLMAWGENGRGQLGDGSRTDRSKPVSVPLPGGRKVERLGASGDHTLIETTDRAVWTWGANDFGQLGDGGVADRRAPVRVGALRGAVVTAIAAGHAHDVVLVRSGPPTELTVSPPSRSVAPGTRVRFAVRAVDVFGTDLGQASAGVRLSIDSGTCQGLVCRATAPGDHLVTATQGPRRGSALLRVTGRPSPSPSPSSGGPTSPAPFTSPAPTTGPAGSDSRPGGGGGPVAAPVAGDPPAASAAGYLGRLASTGAGAGVLAFLIGGGLLVATGAGLLIRRRRTTPAPSLPISTLSEGHDL